MVSNLDPFPSVNGLGIRQLREAGIEVSTDCLPEEGYRLNRRFFHFQQKKRPYIILKWAQTRDGYLDLVREPGDPIGTNWITGDVCRTLVHKWRSEESSIMVGTNTVIADNPRLNVRRWTGEQPVRITIDRHGRLSGSYTIFDATQDTFVFAGVPGKYSARTRRLPVDPSYDLKDLMDELHDQQILSVLVEGGASLLESFIQSGLWDEARVFTGKVSFSQGVKVPEIPADPVERVAFRTTILDIYENHLAQVHI